MGEITLPWHCFGPGKLFYIFKQLVWPSKTEQLSDPHAFYGLVCCLYEPGLQLQTIGNGNAGHLMGY